MIKKIICPVDFSPASINAAEYAGNLAKVFGASLLFMNVQRIIPAAAAVSMGEGIDAGVRESSGEAVQKLKEMSEAAREMFQIQSAYEVDVTTKSLSRALTPLETDDTLIVMGTNGVDDIYQYFFGTNTYHVIRNARCPALIIPENCMFGKMDKIVFAWDYTSENKFSFQLLNDFKTAFTPKFIFLHISKHRTEISSDVFRAITDEIETVFGKENNTEFKQIFSDNIPDSIDEYMQESKTDILALTFYNRGIIRNLFHGTVAKELSETDNYPILVLHP